MRFGRAAADIACPHIVPRNATSLLDQFVSLGDTLSGRFVIQGFKHRIAEAVFNGQRPKGFPADLFLVARRKVMMLDAAPTLDSLKAPPGNKLHLLKKDRAGQHAIWINTQFRLCFRWTDAGPDEVEIVDYHD